MNESSEKRKLFEPCCRATTIGSLPHMDVARATGLMFAATPELPSWVQLPRRVVSENMMLQFTEGVPALVCEGDRLYFDTVGDDYVEQLTDFYERYLNATEKQDAGALDSFGLSAEYAAGFAEFMTQLPDQLESGSACMLKGQVTGPFTLGVNLFDQNQRCAYYDDQLRDVVVKSVAMKAAWQLKCLGMFGLPVMIFLDEPSLLGFGKQTYITISREEVITDINAVADMIHSYGGLAGVHCEENTDWSLLMETRLDILDFDAYDHLQGMTLYPAELDKFFQRGGWLGWGIVPTLDRDSAAKETLSSLSKRFEDGIGCLAATGFEQEFLLRRTLLTPSCGAGGVLDEPLAERVLELLKGLSVELRGRYGFE